MWCCLDSVTELSSCFSISHFLAVNLLWLLILKKEVMQSGLCSELHFFLQNLGHHPLSVKLLRCGLGMRLFTSKTTLPKIWNSRNLFHNFLNLKRENAVCKKKLDQVKSNDPDVEESDNSGDTDLDSIATYSSFSTHSDDSDDQCCIFLKLLSWAWKWECSLQKQPWPKIWSLRNLFHV